MALGKGTLKLSRSLPYIWNKEVRLACLEDPFRLQNVTNADIFWAINMDQALF